MVKCIEQPQVLRAVLYKDLNDMYSELQESDTDDLVPSRSVGHASIEDQFDADQFRFGSESGGNPDVHNHNCHTTMAYNPNSDITQ